MSQNFSGRLAVQQRVLPHYRAPFFDLLAESCEQGMSLFAGQPRAVEAIKTAESLQIARLIRAQNRHLFSGPLYFCYQDGMLDWLKFCDPDALVLEANPRYLATPSAIKWMRARNRPVIGWGLGAPIRSGVLAGLRQKNWMRFLGQFDALIAYSQRGANDYVALGIPQEKVFVAHNAVSAPPLSPPQAGGKPRRGGGARPTVIFVGRLQARKHIDHLLHACAALPTELAPNLLIVGDGPELGTLKNLAAEVYPQAEFTGAKHGAELSSLWERADLFVLPGTGGLAIQEAMAYALPVIVAKGDGTQDDLVRAENGWQIADNDLDALKETLASALSDLPRLREMGLEGLRIVRDEVNIEKMVAAFVRALNFVK